MAHASTEELIEAWEALDERGMLILRKVARSLIRGTEFTEPLDLMHEAFERCLDGRRNWPTEIEFSVCLGNIMRSVACAERLRARRGPKFEEFDESLAEFDKSACHPSVERQAVACEEDAARREAADKVRRSLAGDEAAQKVLGGMLAGLSPKEMRASFHMDDKAFEAARMRVMRRAARPGMH